MNLIGKQVRIGSKYAKEHHYTSIVGEVGLVVAHSSIKHGYKGCYRVEVYQEKYNLRITWNIKVEDLILPNNNESASLSLKEEDWI